MDSRIASVIATLQASGYTDRVVDEHWGENWRDKRWFGFEGTSNVIFQIVTADVYTRVLVVGEDVPFKCLQYKSVKHPARPKSAFYADRSPVYLRKNLPELLRMIPDFESLEVMEAA